MSSDSPYRIFRPHSGFVKTEKGVVAFQTRDPAMGPAVRQLLILVDGKRSYAELSAVFPRERLDGLLNELIAGEYVQEFDLPTKEVKSETAPSSQALGAGAAAQRDHMLPDLPPAANRSAKDLRMARDFMINTVNTMFGQYTRLTLVEAIFACQTTEALRKLYPDWAHAMSESAIGARRLHELREQLAKTL